MGQCASCCGRRRKPIRAASERTPLLANVADPATIHSLSRKAVAVVAAFRAEKYPSQDQIDSVIRSLLRSNVLKEERYGKLSQPGRKILQDVREICELVLVFGLEKNYDDTLQELLHHVRQMTPPTEAAVYVATDTSDAVQNKLSAHELERDIYDFTQSCATILSLFVTSAAFRLFLSSVAKVTQDAATELASDIGDVAETVRDAAEKVEHIAEGVEVTAQEVATKVVGDIDTSVSNLEHLPSEVQGVVREVIDDATIPPSHTTESASKHISREDKHELSVLADAFQVMLSEARQNPEQVQAINTLLNLAEKYLDSFFGKTTATVSDETRRATERMSCPFKYALGDIRAILERLASGKSLSPLLDATDNFLYDSDSADDLSNEIQGHVTEVRAFLARALDALSGYIDSPAAKQDTLHLFDRAKVVYGHYRAHNSAFNNLTTELHDFIMALQNDTTMNRLLVAVTSLMADVEGYASTIRPVNERARHLSEILWNDATAFVWTVLVSFFEGVLRMSLADGRGMIIPIPRVEYTDASVDLALDGRLMRVSFAGEEDEVSDDARATSWSMPSSVHVKQSNEVHLDFASSESTIVRSANKTYIHVEGLLAGEHKEVVSLDDIGYYLRYKPFLGYADEGVVGVDICFGGGSDEGSIDLVVDLTGVMEEEVDAQLSVESVKVNLPPSMGLRVGLSASRHWILNGGLVNSLILPLTTWFVKKRLEGLMEGVIKAAVEEVGLFAHVVAVETKENKRSLWSAIAHAIGTLLPDMNFEMRVEPTMSMKGVQMDIVAHPERDGPHNTVKLAVGVVPQLLPAKAEPAPLESPSAMYDRAVDEIHAAEERVKGEVREVEAEVRQGVGALRQEMDDAPQRVEREEAMYEGTCGWRSESFDIV
ncbi:hypothetical protein CPB85DRAFT_1361043 [Mucidula mucida]|nr:hypothetical protein CPB85DRAFT_1361043 [Mucidula mucida]